MMFLKLQRYSIQQSKQIEKKADSMGFRKSFGAVKIYPRLGIVRHEKPFYFYQVNCSRIILVWVNYLGKIPAFIGGNFFFVNFLKISYSQTIDAYLKCVLY